MSGAAGDPLTEALRRVRDDREHGASWLARQAAQALAEASATSDVDDTAGRLQRIHQAARDFAAARPSMAALANTAARIWYPATQGAGQPGETLQALQTLHSEAQRLLDTWEHAADAIADAASPLLGEALYTFSRSGTVEHVLYWLARDGRLHRVIVGESHPGDEGRTLAQSLAAQGIAVTLITDAACGVYLREASAVVIGADSVRADGAVVNKIGSYALALMAGDQRIPVYALCETLKIAAPSFPLTFEEMDVRELLPEPVVGVTVHNPYFERVPARLINGVITEVGMLDAAAIAHYAEQAETALHALMDERS
ncbi:MAG: hypothetical protein ABI068_04225 [Ktedonobacterales bacterium]